MLTLLSALGSLLSFRIRSRLTLELELVALQHQVTVLRRQRPGLRHLFERRAPCTVCGNRTFTVATVPGVVGIRNWVALRQALPEPMRSYRQKLVTA